MEGRRQRASWRATRKEERKGICCSGQRPSTGTSKVIQCRQKKERKKKLDGTRRKHPTKLVKAAACCLLSPLTREENLKWLAALWQCETQSDRALGGSGGNGGSGAGAAGPCAEEEGLAPPPGAPRDPRTTDGTAKTAPPESPPGCGIDEPW